jgi:cell division protein FtsA
MNRGRRTSSSREQLALLDIGTSKIVCMIVAESELGWRLMGFGHQRSRGLKAGVVVDLEEAEDAVRTTVTQAEQMAGINIEEVRLAVACGRLKSLNFAARADAADGVVQDDDIARVMHAGRIYAERDGRCLLTMNRIGWRLDGVSGIVDPIGLAARKIEADLHAVTADDAPLRNILNVIERCRLGVAQLSVTAHASALAVTSDDERKLGVTVIDLGSGVTSIAEFIEGHLIGVHSIPVGGSHLTFDIARALSTGVAEAERIKTLHGTLVRAPSDQYEMLPYHHISGDDVTVAEIAKSELKDLIAPRIETMFGLVAERLDASAAVSAATSRIVLTGGASELVGLAVYAADILGRPTRVGRPYGFGGMPDSMCGPAFATVVGLLPLALDPEAAGLGLGGLGDAGNSADGYFGRVGRWIKESF